MAYGPGMHRPEAHPFLRTHLIYSAMLPSSTTTARPAMTITGTPPLSPVPLPP